MYPNISIAFLFISYHIKYKSKVCMHIVHCFINYASEDTYVGPKKMYVLAKMSYAYRKHNVSLALFV